MTPEEAAEEILSGQSYALCTRCGGGGWSENPRKFDFMGLRTLCEGCRGAGAWLRGDYVRACLIVGKDPPAKPKARVGVYGDWEPDEWAAKLKEFGRSTKGFAHLQEFLDEHELQSTTFRKEYRVTWPPLEEQNDLSDSMKYSLDVMKLHNPKLFK